MATNLFLILKVCEFSKLSFEKILNFEGDVSPCNLYARMYIAIN
jgi:hypothetical protein